MMLPFSVAEVNLSLGSVGAQPFHRACEECTFCHPALVPADSPWQWDPLGSLTGVVLRFTTVAKHTTGWTAAK